MSDQNAPVTVQARALRVDLLEELPTDTGLVLWQYLRHVYDWMHAGPQARSELFPARTPGWVAEKRAVAQKAEPELAPAFTIFSELLRSPTLASARRVADACEHVAKFATGKGLTRTALLYAEVAANLDDHPRRGILVGKLSREIGDSDGAEGWFRRSVRAARKQSRWEEYIRAHLGLGILFMITKQDARARKHFLRASNRAHREGYEWLAAEAQHDLFQFMTVRGHYKVAEKHARTALMWYSKNHPRLPFLVADAAFLLICKRHYTPAIELLRDFFRVVKTPPQNVLGVSMFARALAAAGERRKFLRVRRTLLTIAPATPFEAAARWHLSEAERALGRWEEATHEANASLMLATSQNDLETALFARATLDSVASHVPAPPEIHELAPRTAELYSLLKRRLAEWAPTKRGRPRRRKPEDWVH